MRSDRNRSRMGRIRLMIGDFRTLRLIFSRNFLPLWASLAIPYNPRAPFLPCFSGGFIHLDSDDLSDRLTDFKPPAMGGSWIVCRSRGFSVALNRGSMSIPGSGGAHRTAVDDGRIREVRPEITGMPYLPPSFFAVGNNVSAELGFFPCRKMASRLYNDCHHAPKFSAILANRKLSCYSGDFLDIDCQCKPTMFVSFAATGFWRHFSWWQA